MDQTETEPLNNAREAIAELRKGTRCLYLAVEGHIADDIHARAERVIAALERYDHDIAEDTIVEEAAEVLFKRGSLNGTWLGASEQARTAYRQNVRTVLKVIRKYE